MKKMLCFIAIFAILTGTCSISAQADDYYGASSWASETLNRASGYGLITERIKGNMAQGITREEFAELALRLYEIYTGKTPALSDISFTDTENPQILKAASAGLVSGVGNGKFSPDAFIAREQMAVILLRTLKVINASGDYETNGISQFSDHEEIASWAKEAVYYCAKNNIVSGTGGGCFSPKSTATREQAVIICTRTYEMLNYKVDVYVNDTQVDVSGIEMIGDTPFADPEPILDRIGAEYQWDEKEKTLAVYYKKEGIAFQEGNRYANHNGTAVTLAVPPYLNGGKLSVPLATLFEALGLKVDWNYRQAYLLIETDEAASPAQKPASQPTDEASLTGLWSTKKTSGVKVDSYGSITEFTYSGEWFYFGADGKFRYTIIFNGQGAFISGKYSVDGDKILVSEANEGRLAETGHARSDKTYTFFFENKDGELRLVMKDENGSTYKCYKADN